MSDLKCSDSSLTNTPNRNDLLPNIELVKVPIQDLVKAKRQVRKASKKHTQRAKRSIEKIGFIDPIIIGPDNEIIDGHIRVEAAAALGLEEVPCIRLPYHDERLLRAARIALNKIQELGEWDEINLRLELTYQLEFETDLTDLGFEAPELDSLLNVSAGDPEELDPNDDIGDLPPPDAFTVTQLGDIWELGDHLISCGNGRDVENLVGLFDANLASLVFTDPPYNVPINGHVRVTTDRFDEFTEASGEMSQEEFTDFLRGFLEAAFQVRKPGALFYVFMDWRHMSEILEAIHGSGFEMVNLCVWAKTNGGMGSFYRSRHELVFVFREPNVSHANNIELGKHGRYRTNVWEYAGATGGKADEADAFSLHPTVKPIRLVADAILDATAVGEIVLDPFLGSGTTLLAAERTKRRCVGIEIAPVYVDVAIRRWEVMTGRQAVHQATGETFGERANGQSIGTWTGTTTGKIAEDF